MTTGDVPIQVTNVTFSDATQHEGSGHGNYPKYQTIKGGGGVNGSFGAMVTIEANATSSSSELFPLLDVNKQYTVKFIEQ